METLGIIVNIVLILASVALIAVVLMQQTKSAGLGGAFGAIPLRSPRAAAGPAGKLSFRRSPSYWALLSACWRLR